MLTHTQFAVQLALCVCDLSSLQYCIVLYCFGLLLLLGLWQFRNVSLPPSSWLSIAFDRDECNNSNISLSLYGEMGKKRIGGFFSSCFGKPNPKTILAFRTKPSKWNEKKTKNRLWPNAIEFFCACMSVSLCNRSIIIGMGIYSVELELKALNLGK